MVESVSASVGRTQGKGQIQISTAPAVAPAKMERIALGFFFLFSDGAVAMVAMVARLGSSLRVGEESSLALGW